MKIYHQHLWFDGCASSLLVTRKKNLMFGSSLLPDVCRLMSYLRYLCLFAYGGVSHILCCFLCPRDRVGGILIYPCLSVRPSRYTYMVCPAISYSFRATALIFCRMFIHIMEVCMSTGFWFSWNILKMTGSWSPGLAGKYQWREFPVVITGNYRPGKYSKF